MMLKISAIANSKFTCPSKKKKFKQLKLDFISVYEIIFRPVTDRDYTEIKLFFNHLSLKLKTF